MDVSIDDTIKSIIIQSTIQIINQRNKAEAAFQQHKQKRPQNQKIGSLSYTKHMSVMQHNLQLKRGDYWTYAPGTPH